MSTHAAWAEKRRPRWELVMLVLVGFFGSFTAGYFTSEERMPLERFSHPQCLIWANPSGLGILDR